MKHDLIIMDENQFSFYEHDKHFTSEASDLMNRHLQPFTDNGKRVQGFGMNYKGNTITFVMVTPHYNEEQELTHWTYQISDESKAAFPDYAAFTAVIYND